MSRWALPAVFALGLGLRLWGIDWGLPYLYHQDEPGTMKVALSFGQGLQTVTYLRHPHLFHELLFGLYGAGYLIGKQSGRFESATAYVQQFLADPSAWVVSGRMLAALFGAATVPLIYWVGRLAYGSRKVALLAALHWPWRSFMCATRITAARMCPRSASACWPRPCACACSSGEP